MVLTRMPCGAHSSAIGLGHPLDRVLGGAIDRAVGAADIAHLAGDIHQAAGFSGSDQAAGHLARQEMGGAQVEADDRVEILGRRVERRGRGGRGPRNSRGCRRGRA